MGLGLLDQCVNSRVCGRFISWFYSFDHGGFASHGIASEDLIALIQDTDLVHALRVLLFDIENGILVMDGVNEGFNSETFTGNAVKFWVG